MQLRITRETETALNMAADSARKTSDGTYTNIEHMLSNDLPFDIRELADALLALGYDVRASANGSLFLCHHAPHVVRAGAGRWKIRIGKLNMDLEWTIGGTATGFLSSDQAQRVLDGAFAPVEPKYASVEYVATDEEL